MRNVFLTLGVLAGLVLSVGTASAHGPRVFVAPAPVFYPAPVVVRPVVPVYPAFYPAPVVVRPVVPVYPAFYPAPVVAPGFGYPVYGNSFQFGFSVIR